MPPRVITMVTDPVMLYEGQLTRVVCKVVEIKPVRNLVIQLLNGTSQLEGRAYDQHLNDDGLTNAVARTFDVIFSRYNHFHLFSLLYC